MTTASHSSPAGSTNTADEEITLPMMRQVLYSAVVADALDSMGYPHQSPATDSADPPKIALAMAKGKATPSARMWAGNSSALMIALIDV